MAIQLQLRRGTTQENDAFMGAVGEVTFDTQEKQLRVHDGTTIGGIRVRGISSQNLLDWKWSDHILNDIQWLRADTFSWQSGSVYEAAYKHLLDDVEEIIPAWDWSSTDGTVYTALRNPSVGDMAYSDNTLETELGAITAVTDNSITVGSFTYNFNGWTTGNISTETINGITISFYQCTDGHKIVIANQNLTKAEQIYNATGVAWYYILDLVNQRFKLPRAKPLNGEIVGNGMSLGLTDGTYHSSFSSNGQAQLYQSNAYGQNTGSIPPAGSPLTSGTAIGLTTDPTKSGIIAERNNTDQCKYLYFYVGEFSQPAIENTAGLNSELFNSKVDIGHEVVAFQAPTAENNYTWYRKYRDGWVEQGGTISGNYSGTITYPVEMANIEYFVAITPITDRGASSYDRELAPNTVLTTGMTLVNFSGGQNMPGRWQVSGMAAQ